MATYSNKDFGAANYAKFRPTYPGELFEYIVKYHQTHSKSPIQLTVDVACGTGQATKTLGNYSSKVIGVDHSETMVKQAREDVQGPKFEFKVGQDTNLVNAVGHAGSVDLITVAEGAHYFRYPEFWQQSAESSKPRGTLALFAYWTFAVPAHPEVAEIINDYAYSKDKCGPYFDEGWRVVDGAYKSLFDSIPRDQFTDIEYRFNDFDEFRPHGEPFESIKKDVQVGSMISLSKTWSAYFNFKKAHPDSPDIADAVMEQITARTGSKADDRVTVKWKTVYLSATKI